MKKITLALIALSLCVLLTACGLSDEEQKKIKLYDEYEDLIEALEDKDEEDVMKELLKIFDSSNKDDNKDDGDNDGDNDGEDNTTGSEQWMTTLIGDWVKSNGVSGITVQDDATCIVNGVSYSVVFNSENYYEGAGRVYYYLMDGDNAVYSIELDCNYAENNNETDIWLCEINGSYVDSYLRASDYNAIKDEWIGKLAGDWVNLDTLTVGADGTCTVDGTKYTVQFDINSCDEGDSQAKYYLSNGDEQSYRISLEKNYQNNDTDTDLWLEKLTEEGYYSTEMRYFSSDDYAAFSSEWLGKLVGDWLSTDQMITFGADNTCEIGEETYTLCLDATTVYKDSSNVRVYLSSANTPRAYYISLRTNFENNGTDYDLSLYANSDNGYEHTAYFYRASEYEAVVLTVDNWLDYFEIAETAQYSENSFGEVTYFYYSRYYLLKEEYSINTTLTDIAIEYTKSGTCYVACTVDPDARTYTLGAKLEDYPWGDETSTGRMANCYINGHDQASRLGFNFCFSGMSQSEFTEGGSILYNDSVEMNRISGILYIVK